MPPSKSPSYATRAQFIRDAVVEKIVALGIEAAMPGIELPPPKFEQPRTGRTGANSPGEFIAQASVPRQRPQIWLW